MTLAITLYAPVKETAAFGRLETFEKERQNKFKTAFDRGDNNGAGADGTEAKVIPSQPDLVFADIQKVTKYRGDSQEFIRTKAKEQMTSYERRANWNSS